MSDNHKRWRELAEKATAGPWRSCRVDACHDDCNVYDDGGLIVQGVHGDNSAFIAAAREAVPALLDEVEELKSEAKRFLEHHDSMFEQSRQVHEENCIKLTAMEDELSRLKNELAEANFEVRQLMTTTVTLDEMRADE